MTFVGHSKGGAEAAANAVATNKNEMVFNPATVNLSAYDLNTEKYTASMTAYIVEGEALNKFLGAVSKPIGKVEYLPTQYKSKKHSSFRTKVDNSIKNHSIESVINALKEAGYK